MSVDFFDVVGAGGCGTPVLHHVSGGTGVLSAPHLHPLAGLAMRCVKMPMSLRTVRCSTTMDAASTVPTAVRRAALVASNRPQAHREAVPHMGWVADAAAMTMALASAIFTIAEAAIVQYCLFLPPLFSTLSVRVFGWGFSGLGVALDLVALRLAGLAR